MDFFKAANSISDVTKTFSISKSLTPESVCVSCVNQINFICCPEIANLPQESHNVLSPTVFRKLCLDLEKCHKNDLSELKTEEKLRRLS